MSDVSDSGSSLGDDSMSDDEKDRKEKQNKEQMSMEDGCCICDVSDASNFDPLVYCDQCNLAVHKLCYGIENIPEEDWFCNTCLYWKKKRSKDPLVDPESKPIKCVLCHRDRGAMKEVHREPDKWVHMVCALFIEEVGFAEPRFSDGIIINKIPAKKRVSDCRKCFYCKRDGVVVDCQCDEPHCNKKFHITCAQERHQLLMTDNSALAIESDRSTEFKVLCSKDQVAKMKEKKQRESEEQKQKRAKEEERRRSKDKLHPIVDPEKRAKLEKLKKLAVMKKVATSSAGTSSTIATSGTTTTTLTNTYKEHERSAEKMKRKMEKSEKIGQKRKLDKAARDPSKSEKKKRKAESKQEPQDERERMYKARDDLYSLYDRFDRTEEDDYAGPILNLEAFIHLLKTQGYESLVDPCRRLWAMREKQKKLREKLESLRTTRELMEKQIQIQETLIYQMKGAGLDRDSPISSEGGCNGTQEELNGSSPITHSHHHATVPPPHDQLNKTT